jgi:Ser-tRNA(Ala) deacylase AlaX
MRHHTSAHLLAAIFYNELSVLITGNQLGTEQSRMDFSMENFDKSLMEEVFRKANEAIHEDRHVKIYFLKREDAMKIPGIVKLAGALPPSIDELRIVEIVGIDIQADGGCHVASLKEIGEIVFLKAENKGKSNRRVYYNVR